MVNLLTTASLSSLSATYAQYVPIGCKIDINDYQRPVKLMIGVKSEKREKKKSLMSEHSVYGSSCMFNYFLIKFA